MLYTNCSSYQQLHHHQLSLIAQTLATCIAYSRAQYQNAQQLPPQLPSASRSLLGSFDFVDSMQNQTAMPAANTAAQQQQQQQHLLHRSNSISLACLARQQCSILAAMQSQHTPEAQQPLPLHLSLAAPAAVPIPYVLPAGHLLSLQQMQNPQIARLMREEGRGSGAAGYAAPLSVTSAGYVTTCQPVRNILVRNDLYPRADFDALSQPIKAFYAHLSRISSICRDLLLSTASRTHTRITERGFYYVTTLYTHPLASVSLKLHVLQAPAWRAAVQARGLQSACDSDRLLFLAPDARLECVWRTFFWGTCIINPVFIDNEKRIS